MYNKKPAAPHGSTAVADSYRHLQRRASLLLQQAEGLQQVLQNTQPDVIDKQIDRLRGTALLEGRKLTFSERQSIAKLTCQRKALAASIEAR